MNKYLITERFHCGVHGEYSSFEGAFDELKCKAGLPLAHKENKCPCTSWETCSMLYEIQYYNQKDQIITEKIVEIGLKSVRWFYLK